MISLKKLTLLRGNKTILNQAEMTLFAQQKVGLVGRNGSGKSSLLSLLLGKLQQDAGTLEMPSHATIAHLAQETPALSISALEYTLAGDKQLQALTCALKKYDEMQYDDLQYAELLTRYEEIEGYTANSRAWKLLSGLGFSSSEITQPVSSFSGGWRMRLNLAQSLMCRADILLLDEPTNHLDLEAVLWLESFLHSYPGMVILISHDRYFLDKIVTHIAHLEDSMLTLYTGNYSAYLEQKTEKLRLHQSCYEKQQHKISHLQRYISRFRAKATKAKQAQSRIKALEKMEKIVALQAHSAFQFSFLEPEKSPNPLLRIEEGSFVYNDTGFIGLKSLNMVIESGVRLGILGVNGAGKSTLIKLLANVNRLSSGRRIEGKGLKIGYFAQHQLESLREGYSALWHLRQLDPITPEQLHRDFLGGFDFQGEMVNSNVIDFSGGERARLALALLLWQRPNLILLDEPTNHLDLEMRDALILALQDYKGAVLVISHDRHFLQTISNEFWLVDKGLLKPFDGDLEDYRVYIEAIKHNESKVDQKEKNRSAPVVSARKGYDKANQNHSLKKRLIQQISALEKDIQILQQEKECLEASLTQADLYIADNKIQLAQIVGNFNKIKAKLEKKEEEWLSIYEKQEAYDTAEKNKA